MLVLFSDHTWYFAVDEKNAREIQHNHIWRLKNIKHEVLLIETIGHVKRLTENNEKGLDK